MKLLRPRLAWALGASVVLTVASSWLPKPLPVTAAPSAAPSWPAVLPDAVTRQGVPAAAAPLPSDLPTALLEPAEADPFAPPVPAAEPVKQALPAPPPPPPALPVAPPLRYRFLGQMTDPAGQRWVYLGKDQQELAVTTGTALEDGYVATAIELGAVRLRHVATETDAVIEIPAQGAAP